jgi:hypothetical protein
MVIDYEGRRYVLILDQWYEQLDWWVYRAYPVYLCRRIMGDTGPIVFRLAREYKRG